MVEQTHKLAVYGTLKRGFHNHNYLHGAVLLGSTWVPHFGMVKEHNYPAAFRFPERSIFCEVYQINDAILERCDRLEGADAEPKHYSRDLVKSQGFGEVFIYHQTNKVLTPYKDMWFPDGIWIGDHLSYKVPWLGWADEIKHIQKMFELRKAAEAGAPKTGAAAASGSIYIPADRKTGRQERVVDPVTGEVSYVPFETNKSTALTHYKKEEPKPPTNYEKARAIVAEGKDKLPEVEVA